MVIDDELAGRLPPGLALAWGFTPPAGRRGPRPGFTIAQIVEAAVGLADTEGFAALSMPKIAKRLSITANALYRYVNSKEELLVLIAEAAWGPPPDSLRRDTHWRKAVTEWVLAILDRYLTHPWLLDMPVRGTPATPNLLRWLETFMECMADCGLTESDIIGCALLLDGYTRSTAHLARDLRESMIQPAHRAATAEFLQPLLRDRGFPLMSAAMASQHPEEDRVDDTDIEFGLKRILDGIEVLISTKH